MKRAKRAKIPSGLRLTTGTPAELVPDIRDLLNAYPGCEVVIQKQRSWKWPYVLTARERSTE